MTVENTKVCIAIMQAYVDGTEVESNKGINTFNGLNPTWNWGNDHKTYKKEVVSFIEFLRENKAYDDYMENTEVRHQRWDYIDRYIKFEDIVNFAPRNWIALAFYWENSPSNIDWGRLSSRWKAAIEHKEVVW